MFSTGMSGLSLRTLWNEGWDPTLGSDAGVVEGRQTLWGSVSNTRPVPPGVLSSNKKMEDDRGGVRSLKRTK